MAADGGYDSESNHSLLRDYCNIRSIIPPEHGRPSPTGKLPEGRYRRSMKQRFDWDQYHHRSQVETVISMLKRNLGSWVRGVTYWSQCRELFLKALTHNILICYLRVFYRALPTPFLTLHHPGGERGCSFLLPLLAPDYRLLYPACCTQSAQLGSARMSCPL